MRPVVDYSKDLRRMLADGKTLDQALGELRAAGAAMSDCLATVRAFRRCDIVEAKQVVLASPAWSDYRDGTEEFLQVLSETDDNDVV